ncbi:MAG TPA: hypothetical protein VK252_04245 [Solirubrobacteraceae bacterium]|nr:hypothetical protein [Solirubrobacteraceae bacterium]
MTLQSDETQSPERVVMLQWVARMGAVTAEALAERDGCTLASARARLLAAERRRLLCRCRPLTGQPTLYSVTPAGMRAANMRGLDPCRISATNAAHAIACAAVAAALERRYPSHRVLGERELRRDEREHGRALASAHMSPAQRGAQLLHRPDLVLWPKDAADGLPVAVEVELTRKAPRRLASICRAWARCRCVAGVIYLAAPDVRGPLAQAIEQAHAGECVIALPLDALSGRQGPSDAIESTVAVGP